MPPVRADYLGHCHFCTKAVYGAQGHAFGIVGWEGIRSGGGANMIMLKQRVPEKIAHRACVREAADRQRLGIGQAQGNLDFT
jgi:hypothetical protein